MTPRKSHFAALLGILFLSPLAASAKSFKEIVDGIIVPLGDQVIALIFALAFIFFLIGIVRLYFTDNAENRAKGRIFIIYGIAGFAVLFTVWGFVRLLLSILQSFST